jgi:hypothetical protein
MGFGNGISSHWAISKKDKHGEIGSKDYFHGANKKANQKKVFLGISTN